MADMNSLHRLRDAYRDIDRGLDARDQKGFSVASRHLQDLMARLRDQIDNTSTGDIVAKEANPVTGR